MRVQMTFGTGGQEAKGRGTRSPQTSSVESGLGESDLEICITGTHVTARALLNLHPRRGCTENQSPEPCHMKLTQERGPRAG